MTVKDIELLSDTIRIILLQPSLDDASNQFFQTFESAYYKYSSAGVGEGVNVEKNY